MLKNETVNNNYNYEDSESVNELSAEHQALWNEMNNCVSEIQDILNIRSMYVGKDYWKLSSGYPVAAYLLSKTFDFNDPSSVDFSTLAKGIDADIINLAIENRIDDSWKDLLALTKKYEKRVFLLASVLRVKSEGISDSLNATPESITLLSLSLLQMEDGEKFADLCCGIGSVAYTLSQVKKNAIVSAYDMNPDFIALAKIQNQGNEISFECKDIFELANDKKTKFDKIFANYPFGMRVNMLSEGKAYFEKLREKIPSVSKVTSSDWIFNTLMMDLLSENGKAIGIMTNGSTWNKIDEPIRKYFVENGFIEAVISLPQKLFYSTSIGTSLIVLSHGNKGVRLIDATNECEQGRRINELSEENVYAILKAMSVDSATSIFLSVEELRANNYVLNASRYLLPKDSIEDGIKFEEIISRITRGASLNAHHLDKLSSNAPTDYQYLMLSNIKDGFIDEELPYLTEIDKKNEKYCLMNKCIILSKNGFPYKVAVAELEKDQKVLANGNLYIIEIDQDKANPYYIAAYLSSEKGIAALKSITVGATIPNIGVDSLKKIIIPLPSLEKQDEIAKKYQQSKEEIALLQLKLEKVKNRMAHLIDEEG